MYKAEFAEKFYNVDTRTLMRWIIANAKLLESLEKTGYKPTNKVFKPIQIALIREALG